MSTKVILQAAGTLVVPHYVRGQASAGLDWTPDRARAREFDSARAADKWLRSLVWGAPREPNALRGHSGVGLEVKRA